MTLCGGCNEKRFKASCEGVLWSRRGIPFCLGWRKSPIGGVVPSAGRILDVSELGFDIGFSVPFCSECV